MTIQRLENEGTTLAARNAADSDYAPLKAKSLYLTDGSPAPGDVATAIAAAAARTKNEQANITFWADENIFDVGTKVIGHDAAQNFGVVAYATAQNNEFSRVFWCHEDHWQFNILHSMSSACGICQFLLDGSSIFAAYDMYAAALTYNQYLQFYGATVGYGRHVLTVRNTGKRLASSGYAQPITKIWIRGRDR